MTATPSLAASLEPIAQQKQSTITAVAYLLLATIVLFPHFIISAFIGAPGLACIAAITIGALLTSTELAFALLVLCLFLQNLFIAIVTPLAANLEHFEPMLGTSFINIVLTSGFAAVAWLKMRNDLPQDNRALMNSLILFFGVIVFYAIIGAWHATLDDALIYTRVYGVGGLFLITGIAFGFRLTPTFTANVFRALTFFLVVWGILEFFFAYDLYSVFNIADYLHLKYAASRTTDVTTVQDMIDFASRSYLNLSGAFGLHLDLLRPQGPNVHSISYAYALAFGALVCYINRFFVLLLLSLALLLLVGAKGPLIMTFVSIALATVYWFNPSRTILLGALIASMILYAAVGIVYGFYTEDYHVVGFMGGVKGFFANPLGRGVGVGGNLSSMAQNYTNFRLFQGYGASFALESGFGVMIYQIGIGTAAFFLFYGRLWKSVWKATLIFSDQPRLVVLPCALALLLVNSIFQEEAFSPAGWGPLLLLSGLLLAHAWQKQKSISPQEI